MISMKSKGGFKKVTKYLKALEKTPHTMRQRLDQYGKAGVLALMSSTPKDTGETAMSWTYDVTNQNGVASIVFSNTKVTETGTPVAILLYYGHGTKQGGYVQGLDYISPALKPIFNKLKDDAWKEVTK